MFLQKKEEAILRSGNVSLISQDLRSKNVPVIELIRDSEQNLPAFRPRNPSLSIHLSYQNCY